MNKVYVLMGQTGEYDDHVTWIARVYQTKDRAKADCNRLNRILRNKHAYLHRNRVHDYDANDKLAILIREKYDAHMSHIDYTGAAYHVIDIDFVEDK